MLTTSKDEVEIVLQAFVDAFVKSPYLMEVKIFFITQVQQHLTYQHID